MNLRVAPIRACAWRLGWGAIVADRDGPLATLSAGVCCDLGSSHAAEWAGKLAATRLATLLGVPAHQFHWIIADNMSATLGANGRALTLGTPRFFHNSRKSTGLGYIVPLHVTSKLALHASPHCISSFFSPIQLPFGSTVGLCCLHFTLPAPACTHDILTPQTIVPFAWLNAHIPATTRALPHSSCVLSVAYH